MPLVDQGPGDSLLARAVVPDPCYWLPGAPHVYSVHIEARQGRRVVAEAERTLGIRPLGVAGRRWRLAGKGWLPRAFHRDLIHKDQADDLGAWREQGAVMIARSPSDELCRQASQQGVLVFAEYHGEDVAAEIRRLTQWPAVGLMVLPDQSAFADDRAAIRNVLFAGRLNDERQVPQTSGPHGLVVDASDSVLLARAAQPGVPILAVRRLEQPMLLAEARAACDDLQAKLAGQVEVAGLAIMRM
jgi:hypothetical protein